MKMTSVAYLAGSLLFSIYAAASPPQYSVTDLGPVANYAGNNAVAGISNTGIVLVNDSNGAKMYWTEGAGTGWVKVLALDARLAKSCEFSTPAQPVDTATGAISHSGKVAIVATSQDYSGTNPDCLATFYSSGTEPTAGTWTYNNTLTYGSTVLGINDAGQLTGNYHFNVEGFGPGCTFFGAASTYPIIAAAMNDSNEIVGSNALGAVVVCSKGVWKALPTLRGSQGATPIAINNGGEVVGIAYLSSGNQTFLYSAGKTVSLGRLSDSSGNAPQCINTGGQVVGVSYSSSGAPATTFLYQNGAMHDLLALVSPSDPYKQVLGISLSGNACINDSGVIVTAGSFSGAPTGSEVFLLTPQAAK
jgi:probable HAF family extracellular repeat protein